MNFSAKKKKKDTDIYNTEMPGKVVWKEEKNIIPLKILGQTSANVFPLPISKILWDEKVPIMRPRRERDPLK